MASKEEGPAAAAAAAAWSVSPLALHLVAVLALWPAVLRLLGWPLATAAAVVYLSLVEAGTRGRAVREARREWEAERAAARAATGSADAGAAAPESCEWLNKLLACAWPRVLAPLLCRFAVSRVNPRLAQAKRPGWLRELHVSRLTLGAAPPRLSDARLAFRGDAGAPELTVRLEYTAGRDLRCTLDALVSPALRIPLQLTRLRIDGTLRVSRAGLSPFFPWVSLLRVAFVTVPDLELAVTPLGGAGVPGVSRWLESQARAALAAHAVEPAARPLHLSARIGDAAPKGRLTLAVHAARRLACVAGADPFVRAALHSATHETGVRRRAVDPDFGGQTLCFDVRCWERARLRVDVLGWRPRGAHAHLGAALLDLRSARVNAGLRDDGTPCALTLRLAAPTDGRGGFAPDQGGEVDVVLSLMDFSREGAGVAPPPPLPPAPADEDGAGAATDALATRAAPDASQLALSGADGPPVPASLIEAADKAAAEKAEKAAAEKAEKAVQYANYARRAAAAEAAAAAGKADKAELAAATVGSDAAAAVSVAGAAPAAAPAPAPASPPKPDPPPPPPPPAPPPKQPQPQPLDAPPAEASPPAPLPAPSVDDDACAVATIEAILEDADEGAAPSPLPPPSGAPADGAVATHASPPASSPFALSLSAGAAPPPAVFLLDVTVHRADALLASVESDPYVRLQLGAWSVETGVRRRMICPDFNDQRFTLRCGGWGAAACTLRVSALGWLPHGCDPVRLGDAALPLRPMLRAGDLRGDGEACSRTLALRGVPHGSVSLTLAVRELVLPVPEFEPPEQAPAAEEEHAAAAHDAVAAAADGDADGAADAHAAVAPPAGALSLVLDTPGWVVLLDADADAAAATATADAPSRQPEQPPPPPPQQQPQQQRGGVTRRASAPASHL
jgi:hypothetical protein